MDVGAWLRGLGFGKYEAAFRDNFVDAAVLPKLTLDDLREIGVVGVGDRRKLFDAIAALAVAGTESAAETVLLPTERRQLTVMFVDLVGSTALSARIDPEDVRVVISSYHKMVAAAVAAAGGFVSKYMGDGVLAYFGYPRAQEDDPERAIDAGLKIAESASALKSPGGESLAVRVGIATGLVVVGDLVGSGESSERGVVGATPNLAARLQGLAEPGHVVIAESTRKLVGELFELQELRPLDLKGIAGPTRAFTALKARAVESRFEALRGLALPDLIGREEEREMLARRWAKAKAGQGHVVLISGEPGVGKSRLTADLLAHVASEPHVRMRYVSSPQSVDSALYPIVGHMERAAGFAREDSAAARLDKLDALLARTSTSPEDAALIADMMGLAGDGRYPALLEQPQARRQKLFAALVGQIERLAAKTPALLVFEDAHWADSSTLEIFGKLFDRIAGLPVLALVTFRPEFTAPWIGQPQVASVTLSRLTREETRALVARIVGDEAIPESVREDIVERADGVPLFAEEIAKAALEVAEDAATRLVASLPSPDRAVPAGLSASLLARLDRLGPAKELAQIGAAIGRSFSFDLLQAVAGKSAAELEAALQRLVDAGLLFREGAPPHAEYLFKHALIQDAAYGALLREPRCALHARIVEGLERLTPDIATVRPETLAQHCVAAGQTERGARLWGEAGKLALARSANFEAETMLSRALALIEGLESSPSLRRVEIEIQIALMSAMMPIRGYSAPESRQAAERAKSLILRAQSLGDALENPKALFAVLWGFWAHHRVAFDGPAMLEMSKQLLSLARDMNDSPFIRVGRVLLASSLIETGSIEQGREELCATIPEFEPGDDARYIETCDYNFVSYSYVTLGYANYLLGYVDQADKCAASAVQNEHHIATIVGNSFFLIFLHCMCGNFLMAIRAGEKINELAAKHRIIYNSITRHLAGALASSVQGDPELAVEGLARAMAERRAQNTTLLSSFDLAHQAHAHLRLGQFEAARARVREALDFVAQRGERWYEADVHRIAGEIARAEGDEAEAEACFERALAISRAQKVRSLELRAAASFARMRRDQGRRTEARARLEPIYAGFSEGFDKPDLKAAKQLLDELA